MSENKMKYEGTVVEHSKGIFKVKVSESLTCTCTISGKIRMSQVRILEGDRVQIEVSEYEPTKGRITYRLK